MSIRPDHWIRRMCREHRMIEPFEEKQVRAGVISYGVSSYGYDIRIADEFKIFTNVNSTIVDPKAMDPGCMVDFKGPVCIIPPNSFALGRSVEYFRVPRTVLCTCLGKSSYARCFRGDTRVALVNDTTATLEEMAERAQEGEWFWGYSLGAFGRIVMTLLEAPRCIGRDALIEIELDHGEKIQCTPDHGFILRNGKETAASKLRPGHSLMPLYRELVRGYESIFQPLDGHLEPTHRLADEWNLHHQIYAESAGKHRHHRDGNRRNNNPWNVERMPAAEHIRLHDRESYGEGFDPEEHGLAIRAARARRSEDPLWREHQSRVQGERARRFWNQEVHAEARARLIERHVAGWTPDRREMKAEEMCRYFSDAAHRAARGEMSREAWAHDTGERRNRQRLIASQIRLREEITGEVVLSALHETGSIRGAARLLGCDRSVFRFSDEVAAVRGRLRRRASDNHEVVSVRELRGEHDVYCVTVPEVGNFALAAGVFVQNCGIITNVTPFEPEWEGFVTLEISNTTPLPAKIYANEGIAQVLFFESDQPCEISYKDKAGKYQAQQGITLPRL